MHTFKFLSLIVISCAMFNEHSNASVKLTFEPESITWHIECDGNNQIIGDNFCSSNETNTITNKYFTFDEVNIKCNKLVFSNFQSNLNGDYNLVINGVENVTPKVVLDYEYNKPYIPRLHLDNISKLKIKCKSANRPINGTIDDLDIDKIWFNTNKIAYFDSVKIMPREDSIPTVLCDDAIAAGKTCKVLLSRFAPTKLADFIRQFNLF